MHGKYETINFKSNVEISSSYNFARYWMLRVWKHSYKLITKIFF